MVNLVNIAFRNTLIYELLNFFFVKFPAESIRQFFDIQFTSNRGRIFILLFKILFAISIYDILIKALKLELF